MHHVVLSDGFALLRPVIVEVLHINFELFQVFGGYFGQVILQEVEGGELSVRDQARVLLNTPQDPSDQTATARHEPEHFRVCFLWIRCG